MKDVSTLQAAINKRAEERLDRDLKGITIFFENNPILSRTGKNSIDEPFPELFEKRGDKMESVAPFWIFRFMSDRGGQRTSYFMAKLKEYFLPDYIKSETEDFINRIDRLENETNYLLDKSN